MFQAIIALAWCAIILGGFVGWVMNIIALAHIFIASGSQPIAITGMLIGRVIGIFAFPLGGILGYF